MADLDREPFWTKQRAWTPADETETRKVRFENRNKIRSEVLPCDGSFGIEFLLALTLPQFNDAYKEQNWESHEGYTKFGSVLTGDMKVTWDETLEKEFPQDSDRTDDAWESAVDSFVKRYLNCKRPRDVQLRHHEAGYGKGAAESPNSHFRRFKESLRHAIKLPAGVKPNPTDEEIKEWYFRTYCRKHRYAFLKSGNGKDDLENSTMEDITDFMHLQHESDINDSTVTKILLNVERTKNGHKSPGNGDKHYRQSASYRRGRDEHRWDRRRDGSPDQKSYRDSDNKRRSRQPNRPDHNNSRRYDSRRSHRESRNDKGYDNRRSDEERDCRGNKADFYRPDKRDCKLHCPCKHTYEECSLHPRNKDKKKSYSSRRHESHHQDHDESSGASSDSSRSEASSRSHCSYSSNDDNFHAHGSWSESEDDRDTRKQLAKKKKKKDALKKRNKYRRRILEDSDSEAEDEFAGSKK